MRSQLKIVFLFLVLGVFFFPKANTMVSQEVLTECCCANNKLPLVMIKIVLKKKPCTQECSSCVGCKVSQTHFVFVAKPFVEHESVLIISDHNFYYLLNKISKSEFSIWQPP